MYTVTVRDHMMIAHSLPHAFFGPAQGLHGAKYVVDAEFSANELDAHNEVVDIGPATETLKTVLADLNYRNLDEMPEFRGQLTTPEFLARYVHGRIRQSMPFAGMLKITLNESHVAAASYGD